MSDIKRGDLVVLVRGHKCVVEHMGGIPFKVRAVHPATLNFSCSYCHDENVHGPGAHASGVDVPYTNIPLSWLKRIPPLEELESRKEEAHA